MRRLAIGLFTGFLVLAGERAPGAEQTSEVPREDWLPSVEEIVAWHGEKAARGATLTGSEGWRHFLTFLEREFASAGVLDLERNHWTFERWRTSQWPDDSGWSLTLDGAPVPVANAGANSGATGPRGLTAPLVLLSEEAAPTALAGSIAVLRLTADAAVVRGLATLDYEFRQPDAAYPWGSNEPLAGPPDSVSWRLFPQLMQSRSMLRQAQEAGAAGALLVFDAGPELAAGLHTFPVPDHYDMPTLILDREAGDQVLAAAARGAQATLRLEARREAAEAWQLVGFLPGRHYGTERDEWIQLVTHTDGPSISQDNGALGLLAVVRYFAQRPRAERPRSLMVFLDCRHYMPGQEEAHAKVDWFHRHPGARDHVAAVVGMEHLGQIEFVEFAGPDGDGLQPSGRVDPSLVWVSDDERLLRLAVAAVRANELAGATVRNVKRPGVHGGPQGTWYGMAAPRRIGGKPAVATMGTMGAYWSFASGLERLDAELFRRQAATFVQITDGLMRFGDQTAPD